MQVPLIHRQQHFPCQWKNATLEQAIDRIEEETGYSFLYADHVLDVSRIVNLEANNKDINLVLSRVFDNMNVDYKIVDKQIILSRKLESIPLAQQPRTHGTRSRVGFEPRTSNRR